MRGGVDKSREADAQALGRATQHYRTLKSSRHEKRCPHTGNHFKVESFQKRWFMPEGANVLLECSMQEGYAWIGETDESAGRSLVLFLHGVGISV